MKTANIENGLDSQVGMIWEKRAHVLLSEEEIERRVSKALAMLLHKDRYRLNVQVNERSLTHRFGIYLQEVFPEYDVDCEYNRDLTVSKQLQEKNSIKSSLGISTGCLLSSQREPKANLSPS